MAESNINIKPGTQYIGAQHRRTPYFTHDLLSATKVDYDMLAALTEADIKSIDVMWWCEYIANKRRLRNEFLAHE